MKDMFWFLFYYMFFEMLVRVGERTFDEFILLEKDAKKRSVTALIVNHEDARSIVESKAVMMTRWHSLS